MRVRVLLALLGIVAVSLGEVGSTLTPWPLALDATAGAVFLTCGVIAAGDRPRFAFAAPAYAAGVLWFLANRVEPLLFAWRPAMVLAMLAAQRCRVSRLERVTATLFVVAAAAPRSSADPWVALGLSGLLIVPAALRVRTPSTVLSSSWPQASSIALALGLAIPAVGALMDLPPTTSAGFTLVNSGLVSLAGAALIVVALRERDLSRMLTDSVVELSRDDHVDSSRVATMLGTQHVWTGHHPDREVDKVLQVGRRMLAENQRLRDALEDQIAEVHASRRRLLEAADVERVRVEHRLDEGVRPLLDELDGELRRLVESSTPDNTRDAARCVEEVSQLRVDLHHLVSGMPPQVLVTGGLCAALGELGARSLIETQVQVPLERLPPDVETAVWYACAECMANIGKYAHANEAKIVVFRTPRGVEFAVTDDGVGGASVVDGGGLSGLQDRMQAVGGGLAVHSDGCGTRVDGWVPCPPR